MNKESAKLRNKSVELRMALLGAVPELHIIKDRFRVVTSKDHTKITIRLKLSPSTNKVRDIFDEIGTFRNRLKLYHSAIDTITSMFGRIESDTTIDIKNGHALVVNIVKE